MNFRDFLNVNKELVFVDEDTGGGCSALKLQLGEHYCVLITSTQDPVKPTDNETEVCVGYYDEGDGDPCIRVDDSVKCEDLSAHLLTLAIKSIL